MKSKLLLKKEVKLRKEQNVLEVDRSSSQAYNIEDAFQSVMSKLTSIELEQAQLREFVT